MENIMEKEKERQKERQELEHASTEREQWIERMVKTPIEQLDVDKEQGELMRYIREVFGPRSEDKCREWLRSRYRKSDKTPLQMMKDKAGFIELLKALVRLDYGISA